MLLSLKSGVSEHRVDSHIPVSVRAMISAAIPFVVLGADLNSQQIPHNARASHLRGGGCIY